MAFQTVDQIINALTASGRSQSLEYHKVSAQNTVVSIPASTWAGTGLPSAGGNTTAGAANGRTLTSSTAGALVYTNASGGRTMSVLGFGTQNITGVTSGMLFLVDRISDCNISAATQAGNSNFTGLDATSRLGSAEGAKLWVEVSSALGAASINLVLNYTNEAGIGSRSTTVVTTLSATAGRSVNASVWQDLQSGDQGVRSVQSYSIASGTTGNINVCLVRQVAALPITALQSYVTRDLIVDLPSLPSLFDNSCLTFVFVPSTASSYRLHGFVKIAEN